VPSDSLLLQNEELWMEHLKINPTVQRQQGNIITKMKEKRPLTPTYHPTLHLPRPSWFMSKSQGKDAQQPQYPWEMKDRVSKGGTD